MGKFGKNRNNLRKARAGKLPVRLKSHENSRKAVHQFQNAIDSAGWIFRESGEQDDFGVDGEVEIVDAGYVSGKVFKVQIKGTSATPTGSPSITLKREHLHYYRSHSLPVLLVLVNCNSGVVYCKWFEKTLLTSLAPGQKTLKIRLQESDIWGEDIPKTLLRQFDILHSICGAKDIFPISIVLTAVATGVSLNKVKLLLAESQVSKFVRVAAAEPFASIVVGDQIGFSIDGLVKFDANYDSREEAHVANQVVVTLALGLNRLGQHTGGCELLFRALRLHSLPLDAVQQLQIVDCFRLSHRFGDLFDVTKKLWDESSSFEAEPFFLFSTLICQDEGIIEDQLVATVDTYIKRHERLSSGEALGTAYYNAANKLRRYDNRRAARYYCRAVGNCPSYRGRAYFWRELGGVMFEKGLYRFAARFYKKSVRLSDSYSLSKFLCADALLFGGYYREALEMLRSYLKEYGDVISDAALFTEAECKYRLARYIVEEFAVEQQVRRSKTLSNLLEQWQDVARADCTSLREWVQVDALHSDAWKIHGSYCEENGDYELAAECFKFAAISLPTKAGYWFSAFNNYTIVGKHSDAIAMIVMLESKVGREAIDSLMIRDRSGNVVSDKSIDDIIPQLRDGLYGILAETKKRNIFRFEE